jgi:hypothetical protein
MENPPLIRAALFRFTEGILRLAQILYSPLNFCSIDFGTLVETSILDGDGGRDRQYLCTTEVFRGKDVWLSMAERKQS